MVEVDRNQLQVVNPLTVSVQSSGKKRLIIDLRYLNKHVYKQKIKLEDWQLHPYAKLLRPIVKHWRSQGIKAIVYLDGGIDFEYTERQLRANSDLMKSDLLGAGFIFNEEKSVWTPTQEIVWLGII